MILKRTKMVPNHRCNVKLVMVFHLFQGFKRQFSKIGNFTKSSIKKIRPKSWLKKKQKTKNIIILTKKEYTNYGLTFKFKFNNCILLKHRTNCYGKEMFGPIPFVIKRKKFKTQFKMII